MNTTAIGIFRAFESAIDQVFSKAIVPDLPYPMQKKIETRTLAQARACYEYQTSYD
jgi:hypothetical protein